MSDKHLQAMANIDEMITLEKQKIVTLGKLKYALAMVHLWPEAFNGGETCRKQAHITFSGGLHRHEHIHNPRLIRGDGEEFPLTLEQFEWLDEIKP